MDECRAAPEQAGHLMDRLQSLLEQEIERVRQGYPEEPDSFGRQTEPLVQEITRTGLSQLPEFAERRARLRQLYVSLSLMMTARRAEVSDELAALRRGRKMLKIYRDTI